MSITDTIKRTLVKQKAVYLKREAAAKFAGVVHNCCNVSANNHSISFAVRRSVFGFPMLEKIDRPQEVQISEHDDCVIVKDGFVYELTKRIE